MRNDFDDMTDAPQKNQSSGEATFVLHAHRSLPPVGFLILMAFVGAVSFVVGVAFMLLGAWPVTGFFGLDVALIYFAFRLNYRSGRLYETITLSPEALRLVRNHPSGLRDEYEFNPYWTRVHCTTDRPDGRTSIRLAEQGREVRFGQFLTDDERQEFADVLSRALASTRGFKF